ncbi:MAG: DUF58 domain-containing protein [archaeon]|nr:DUF58 domain-containing protein [archaeon]
MIAIGNRTKQEEKDSTEYHKTDAATVESMNRIDSQIRPVTDTFQHVLKNKIIDRNFNESFSSFKEYEYTDDANLIDWEASARISAAGSSQDRFYIRTDMNSHNTDICILHDISASMFFGTQDRLKSEYASVLAGMITHAAINNGNGAGIIFFNSKVREYIAPEKGKSQYSKILEKLAADDICCEGCNIKDAIKTAVGTLNQNSVLFIISDFIGIDKKDGEWVHFLKDAALKFKTVVGIMIRDIRDSKLPAGIGIMRVRDPVTDNVARVDIDGIRQTYEAEAKIQESYMSRLFNGCGAELIKYYTTDNHIAPIAKHFNA